MILIESIKPSGRERVMDLVQQTGIDVSDWSNYAKGASAPAANPRYCYEWSFESPDVVVLNLWHGNMKEEQGRIIHRENYRGDAEAHRAAGAKSNWYQRGFALDRSLQAAIRGNLPVRVIVNEGVRRGDDDKASTVTLRKLDNLTWTIAEYDWQTGACLLIRALHAAGHDC